MTDRKPVSDWTTDWDHLDPRWTSNPYPIWDELRQTWRSKPMVASNKLPDAFGMIKPM